MSHAILVYNRGRTRGLADGIVITPSHNPPEDGGFKYNPPNGGPADTDDHRLDREAGQRPARGRPAAACGACRSRRRDARLTTHEHDFLDSYVDDLGNVIDIDAIRDAGIRMGVDPLGGAGVHYWARIAERYRLDLTVVSDAGRSDVSLHDARLGRPHPHGSVLALRHAAADRPEGRYDIAFACDTDHDRHGIVTRRDRPDAAQPLPRGRDRLPVPPSAGLARGCRRRQDGGQQPHDRPRGARLGRRLYEVPVGFKWFVDGLLDGSLGFGGEESAGASFLRRDGTVWTTDKDGIVAALLSAEITARTGRDPGERYRELTRELGAPASDRVDAPATPEQKKRLAQAVAGAGADHRAGGRADPQVLEPRAGQRRADRRHQGRRRERLVRRASVGHREHLQDLRARAFRGEEHLQSVLAQAQLIVDATLSGE